MPDANVRIPADARDRLAEVAAAEGLSLRAYLAQKPYDAAAHLVLGYNLRFSGDPEGARRALLKVLEIDPGNEAASALLGALPAPTSQPASK